MVAAPSVTSRKQGRQQGRKQGKLPKAILSTRISQEIDQELANYWYSQEANCSKSEVVESLLAKALKFPQWVEIGSYEQLPAGKHTYVIFDGEGSMVEMGLAENLHQEIAQHPKLDQYVADQCKVIYFAAQ